MNIKPYMKTVAAVIGGLITVLTFIAGMQGVLPDTVTSAVVAALGVLTPLSVWWVKNESLIVESVEAVEDLVDTTVGAFQSRG